MASEVVGKDIDEIQVSRVAGSSLTSGGVNAAIETIKGELGASGMKDMGRVMAELKARHATELDMSKASAAVKAANLLRPMTSRSRPTTSTGPRTRNASITLPVSGLRHATLTLIDISFTS